MAARRSGNGGFSDCNVGPVLYTKQRVMDALSLQQHLASAWRQVTATVEEETLRTLVIGFIGSPSAGKDSLIKALFDVDFGDIAPVPGSTATVRVAPIDPSGQVRILTAPGVGDLRQELTAMARAAVDQIDLVVLVINAQAGVDVYLHDLSRAVRELNRPRLGALNKIDLVANENERARLRSEIARVLILEERDVIPTAAAPHPGLGTGPIGLAELSGALYRLLERSGKSLVLARVLAHRDAAADQLILSATLSAAAIGAVPVPGSDFGPLTLVQTAMLVKLARIYRVEMAQADIAALLVDLLAGQSGRLIFQRALTLLKSAGYAGGAPGTALTAGLAALVASSVTFGLGQAGKTYFRSGRAVEMNQLSELFARGSREYFAGNSAGGANEDGL